jgi:hypothetical protein
MKQEKKIKNGKKIRMEVNELIPSIQTVIAETEEKGSGFSGVYYENKKGKKKSIDFVYIDDFGDLVLTRRKFWKRKIKQLESLSQK